MVASLGTPKYTPVFALVLDGCTVWHALCFDAALAGSSGTLAGSSGTAEARNSLIFLDYFSSGSSGSSGNKLSTSRIHYE